jgi:hypothetical protein
MPSSADTQNAKTFDESLGGIVFWTFMKVAGTLTAFFWKVVHKTRQASFIFKRILYIKINVKVLGRSENLKQVAICET